MLGQLNFDVIFNWPIWTIIKWIIGTVILFALVISIYWNYTLAKELAKQKSANEWDLTVISKIVFDTKADDTTLIKLISEYINKKEAK